MNLQLMSQKTKIIQKWKFRKLYHTKLKTILHLIDIVRLLLQISLENVNYDDKVTQSLLCFSTVMQSNLHLASLYQ